MNIEQMRYIVEAAKTGSLTQAAKNLHITLSAMSQSISQLESELGFPLFTRSRGVGASLTPEGINIINKANEILLKIDEILAEAQSYTKSLSGHLRIDTIPGPIHLLIDTVSSFKKEFPMVTIEIFEKGTKEIVEDLRNNQVDLGFILITKDLEIKQKDLYYERVLEGKLVLGVNKNSPLLLNNTITPSELSGQTLVLYDDEFIKTYVLDLIKQYADVNILFISNNTRAIQSAVEQGIAVTIGFDYLFSNLQSELATVQLDLPFPSHFYYGLVYRKDRLSSPIAGRFIHRIQVEG